MDNLTTHTLADSREILFVEVKDWSNHFEIKENRMVCYEQDSEIFNYDGSIDLPQGNWRIIGVSDQMSEEQCSRIVEHWSEGLFEDYTNEMICLSKAKDSFDSLLRSLGLNTTKKYVLLEKLK